MASPVRGLPLLLAAAAAVAASLFDPLAAQQQGYGQTLNGAGRTGTDPTSMGTGKGGSVLDAVNPIDLMNRIRKNQALDDATSPGDAVDAALRNYASQTPGPGAANPAKPAVGASGLVKAP